jgi:hypothetical protein
MKRKYTYELKLRPTRIAIIQNTRFLKIIICSTLELPVQQEFDITVKTNKQQIFGIQ